MEYTKIEQLTVGTGFVEFLEGKYYVTYEVVKNDGDTAYMKSKNIPGYDFELTQDDIDLRLQCQVLPLYDTLETAKKSVDDWESHKISNNYNDDEVLGWRKGDEYYFQHVPTGKKSETWELMKTTKDMEEDVGYYQIELDLFSGRKNLFLQEILGV